MTLVSQANKFLALQAAPPSHKWPTIVSPLKYATKLNLHFYIYEDYRRIVTPEKLNDGDV